MSTSHSRTHYNMIKTFKITLFAPFNFTHTKNTYSHTLFSSQNKLKYTFSAIITQYKISWAKEVQLVCQKISKCNILPLPHPLLAGRCSSRCNGLPKISQSGARPSRVPREKQLAGRSREFYQESIGKISGIFPFFMTVYHYISNQETNA